MDLKSMIEELLAKGYEGGDWDYKSDYPNTAGEKLHDNLEDRDAYLIYGANDDGSVCGIENTERPRYKTADIIKFLRDKPFTGGYAPQVEAHTLKFQEHEADVPVIYRGIHTPYYLWKGWGNTHKLMLISVNTKSM